MNPIVHVVDDNESFLRSVSRLLRTSGYTVKTFSSVQQFLKREHADAPGCVLTDLQMPRQSGLALQELLARTSNPLPVVFLTSKGDIPTTVRAMRQGAEDFLTKRAPREKLLQAVDRALARDTEERLARQRRHALRAKFDTLCQREWQVLAGVVRGLLNKQIAEETGMAERTVKHHRSSLTQKLGVPSAAELVALVKESEIDIPAGGGAGI